MNLLSRVFREKQIPRLARNGSFNALIQDKSNLPGLINPMRRRIRGCERGRILRGRQKAKLPLRRAAI